MSRSTCAGGRPTLLDGLAEVYREEIDRIFDGAGLDWAGGTADVVANEPAGDGNPAAAQGDCDPRLGASGLGGGRAVNVDQTPVNRRGVPGVRTCSSLEDTLIERDDRALRLFADPWPRQSGAPATRPTSRDPSPSGVSNQLRHMREAAPGGERSEVITVLADAQGDLAGKTTLDLAGARSGCCVS